MLILEYLERLKQFLHAPNNANLYFSVMFSIPFHSSLLQMEARTVGVEPETPPHTGQDARPSHGYPTN